MKKIVHFFVAVAILCAGISVSAQGGFEVPTGNGGFEVQTSQTGVTDNSTGLKNPLKNKEDTVPELLNLILKEIIIPIGGILVVLMIIYTGFLFVIAQGNPEKIKKAREAFFWVIIGAALILGAFAISEIVESLFKEVTNAVQ